MPLQSSGVLSFSNVRVEFGSAVWSFSNLYGVAAGVPTSGIIKISDLLGKAASTPAIVAPSTCNISTNASAQSGTWELSNLVTDTYGKPLTYSVTSYNSIHFSSASIANSLLSYSIPINKFSMSSPIAIQVTNRFGRTNTISPTFAITGYNIYGNSFGSVTLSNNTVSYNLGTYFTDYSGTGLGYWISNNPQNNAYISGTTLYIPGNYRGLSYNVSVSASNSYNQVTSASLAVTETTMPITYSNMMTFTDWYISPIAVSYANNANVMTTDGTTDPNVQMMLGSAIETGTTTHMYYQERLQNAASVSFEFQIWMSQNRGGALFLYLGHDTPPTDTLFQNQNGPAYKVVFQATDTNSSLSTGIHIVRANSSSAQVSLSTTSHMASAWIPVKIIYNRSSTNTIQVYFNNNLILTDNNSSIETFVTSTSGRFWGIGCKNSLVSPGYHYIRRLQVGTYNGSIVKEGSFRSGILYVGWESATGISYTWGTGNKPASTLSGGDSLMGFSTPDGQSVTQTVTNLRSQPSWTFEFFVRSGAFNGNVADTFQAFVTFRNSANTIITTIGYNTNQSITETGFWTRHTFTTSVNTTSATSATITLIGKDNGSWNGQYGPWFTNVSLY